MRHRGHSAGLPRGRTEGRPIASIVFVHGTRTSSAIWAPQVDALRDAGHHCLAIDLPGHGVRVGERLTLPGALSAIGAAVRSCPTPPLLVGLSLGGYTSLAYAAQHPDAVTGVVLSGCSTEIRGKPLRLYRTVSLRVAHALRPTGHTWHVVADMLTSLAGYSAVRDLRRLQVPVWVVNGSRDLLRLGVRRYASAHPGLRQVVVRGAGHDVNSHAPAAFNRVLLQVLGSLGGAPSVPAGPRALLHPTAGRLPADVPTTDEFTSARRVA